MASLIPENFRLLQPLPDWDEFPHASEDETENVSYNFQMLEPLPEVLESGFDFSDISIDQPPQDMSDLFLSVVPQQVSSAQPTTQVMEPEYVRKLEIIRSSFRRLSSKLKPFPMEETFDYMERLKIIRGRLEVISVDLINLVADENFKIGEEPAKLDEVSKLADDVEKTIRSINKILKKEKAEAVLELISSKKTLKLEHDKYIEEANRLKSLLDQLTQQMKQELMRIQTLENEAKRAEHDAVELKSSLWRAEAELALCSKRARYASYVASSTKISPVVSSEEEAIQTIKECQDQCDRFENQALMQEEQARNVCHSRSCAYWNQAARVTWLKMQVEEIIQRESRDLYNKLSSAANEKVILTRIEKAISGSMETCVASRKKAIKIAPERINLEKGELSIIDQEVILSRKRVSSANVEVNSAINAAEEVLLMARPLLFLPQSI